MREFLTIQSKKSTNYLRVGLERCRNLPYYLSVIHYVFGNYPSIFSRCTCGVKATAET